MLIPVLVWEFPWGSVVIIDVLRLMEAGRESVVVDGGCGGEREEEEDEDEDEDEEEGGGCADDVGCVGVDCACECESDCV